MTADGDISRIEGEGRADSIEPPAPPSDLSDYADIDRGRLNTLFTLAYEELHRLASALRRREGSVTVQTTAILNEAWLKLAASPHLEATTELHFRRIAVRAMRQVLIDAARRRKATKRGAAVITLDEGHATTDDRAERVLALDEALERLAKVNPRQARMVEARFFGGLDIAETARLLEISEATVLRDWRLARAWLATEMKRGEAAR
jgi:RNA polymerase sigma factor (TIGR02999 family)